MARLIKVAPFVTPSSLTPTRRTGKRPKHKTRRPTQQKVARRAQTSEDLEQPHAVRDGGGRGGAEVDQLTEDGVDGDLYGLDRVHCNYLLSKRNPV